MTMDTLTGYDFDTVEVAGSGWNGYQMDSEVAFTKKNFHKLIDFTNTLIVTVNRLEDELNDLKNKE